MTSNDSRSPILARLFKGVGAQGFAQAVSSLVRLGEVPLFLGFWGPHLYGEWLMLFAIPSYLAIGDGGFCTAACHDMTMLGQGGDTKGALRVFQSTWLLLILISVAVGICAIVFVNEAPIARWLGFSIIGERQLKIIFLLLTAYVLVGFQGGLLNGALWIAGRYPTAMVLGGLSQLLEFTGLAMAVAFGYGPVKAASGLLAGRLLGVGLSLVVQRRVTPWVHHGKSHASISEVRRLFGPALASLALPLGSALNTQGIRLAVGLALGPPAVAVFSAMRTLTRLAAKPCNIINRLIEPELAIAFGLKDKSLFRGLLAKSSQASIWGCIATCVLVAPAARWVYPIWTRGRVSIHWPAFMILLAVTFVNGVWYTLLMGPYSTNRHGRMAVVYLFVFGLAVCGLGYFGAVWAGLSGACFALLAAECVMAMIVIRAALRMAGLDTTQFIKIVARPPLALSGRIFRTVGRNLRSSWLS